MGLVALAVVLGTGRLADNSFLTHLATGRLIHDTGGIPRVDPYTFTAHGEPWVVQSWLPSWLYALIEDVAGAGGLRLLMGLLFGAIVTIAWRLSGAAEALLVRVAVVGLVIGVGSGLWSERPFLFGLVFLGLTALAAEGKLDPRWLLPVAWLWVNSHGSFPLGFAYLAVVLVGTRLDRGPSQVERRCLAWFTGGLLLGALNPLGPRLLLFPLQLLQRQEVLRHVGEWQAPTFQDTAQRIFLVQLAVAILALVRRPSYRAGLVVAVFTVAALLGLRNLAVSSLVLVPILAGAWAEVGTLRASATVRAGRLIPPLLVAVGVLGVASKLQQPHFDLDAYPMRAVRFLDAADIDLGEVRLAGPERVGNLLEGLHGAGRRVFFDDRFDMFPDEVNDANLVLFQGSDRYEAVLDEWEISLVLFERDSVLARLLAEDEAWSPLDDAGDDTWVLYCRRGAAIGGDVGRC